MRRSPEANSIASWIAARLVDSRLHFEWSGLTGPGNLGNAPKVPPASADMRPDPSGKPAFRPLAMHQTDDVRD